MSVDHSYWASVPKVPPTAVSVTLPSSQIVSALAVTLVGATDGSVTVSRKLALDVGYVHGAGPLIRTEYVVVAVGDTMMLLVLPGNSVAKLSSDHS